MTAYDDGRVSVHLGDCLDVLRSLPDASVDAVVTDPPYGLEFMGKEWDAPWKHGFSATGYTDGGTRPPRPNYGSTRNPVCRTCRQHQRGSKRCVCLTPDFDERPADSNRAFQEWCEQWATECLRVLKPGGHMLAFGGTRTWHRLACAVEDAGFEVRDSIAWLYGSGFPKSLDVSKAIDKHIAREEAPTAQNVIDAGVVGAWLRDQCAARGIGSRQINEHFDAANVAMRWMLTAPTETKRPQVPKWDQWEELRRWLDLPDDMDAEVWRLNGMKGTPAPLAFAREAKVYDQSHGFARVGLAHGAQKSHTATAQVEEMGYATGPGDAPATPDAERWQGWGTALKPSHEPVCVAVKPYGVTDILDAIGSHIARLEDECRPTANGAARSSAPTPADSPEVRTATAPESAATPHEDGQARTTPTGAAGGSSAATDTSASESTAGTCWSTVTSWRACWVELYDLTSTSTTSTASSLTTDLRTLWSSIASLTVTSTPDSPTPQLTSSSTASAVDSLFAATVLRSRATLALSATEPATASTPQRSPAAGGSATAFEPVVVARKPLSGTVAANVLTHGTGALNVDGCRVGTDGGTFKASKPEGASNGIYGNGINGTVEIGTLNAGRWPANVVLDESQAAALDEMSGELSSGGPSSRDYDMTDRPRGGDVYAGGIKNGVVRGHPGTGGASRFFYVAKAPKRERPTYYRPTCECEDSWPSTARATDVSESVDDKSSSTSTSGSRATSHEWSETSSCGECGAPARRESHATVKPLDLMRWLVRLVTPPGGTVLEPFAGSGTTVEACIVEGFRCIAIEREPDYLPLILQRIHRRRDPVAAIRQTGDDLGLFELDGEPA